MFLEALQEDRKLKNVGGEGNITGKIFFRLEDKETSRVVGKTGEERKDIVILISILMFP